MIDQKAGPCIFGEVLFDRFPDGSEVLGGAPFNVAWNLQALGCRPFFMSSVGDDDLGSKIISSMHAWGMDTTGVQTDPLHPTGTVDITIKDNEPTFNIVANSAYDHISAKGLPAGQVSIIYHGSLALRDASNRKTLEMLRSETAAPVFMDVNLRDPWWNKQDLDEFLDAASWVKLNENEIITLATGTGDLFQQVGQLQQAHNLDMVIVTLGSQGAFASTRDGKISTVNPSAGLDVVDTVGAGDAFASVCILGLLKGWEIVQVLERAQDFASGVVGLRGATTNDKDFYQAFVRKWA